MNSNTTVVPWSLVINYANIGGKSVGGLFLSLCHKYGEYTRCHWSGTPGYYVETTCEGTGTTGAYRLPTWLAGRLNALSASIYERQGW